MKYAKKLRKGDKVAIVSLSSGILLLYCEKLSKAS